MRHEIVPLRLRCPCHKPFLLIGLGEISQFNSERLVLSPAFQFMHGRFRHCVASIRTTYSVVPKPGGDPRDVVMNPSLGERKIFGVSCRFGENDEFEFRGANLSQAIERWLKDHGHDFDDLGPDRPA
jgi:hypothetical protein